MVNALRIQITESEPIFNPTVEELKELRERLTTGDLAQQRRNYRVVFNKSGNPTPAVVKAMAGLPIIDFDNDFLASPLTPKIARGLAGLPIDSFRYMGLGFTAKVAGALAGAELPIRNMELSTLSFTGNIANALIPVQIAHLELRECWGLSAAGFKALAQWPLDSLTLWHITSNRHKLLLTGGIFKEIAKLPRLTELNLWGSEFTAEMFQQLAERPLTSLGLSRCPLTVGMIQMLAGWPITELDLSHCKLTVEIVEALAALSSLRDLDVSECRFTHDSWDLLRKQFPDAQLVAA